VNCGMAVQIPEKRCAVCGTVLKDGVKFCPECGGAVPVLVEQPAVQPWREQPVIQTRQEQPEVQTRQAAVRKPFTLTRRKKALFALAACLVLAAGVGLFTRKQLKEAKFFSVDLNRQVTFGTPISFSGGGSLADELQWLAVRTACIGVYNSAQTRNPTLEDPKDHYQPSDIREFLTVRSGAETKTDMFYGVCFNYAQAAYEDMTQNSSYYRQMGVRGWYIASVADNPRQITLSEPVRRESEADMIMNGVYVKTVSVQNARAHNDTTNHAWLWVYGKKGEIYWIDPTWTDNTGYVVWGVVRNGEEIQLNPLESLNKVSVDPSDEAFGWINQGNANKNKNEHGQAVTDYTAALEKDPGNAAVYISRGIAFGEMRDFNAALDDFNKAIQLSPELGSAYTMRGRALAASVVTVLDVKPGFSDFTYKLPDGWDTAENKRTMERAIADFNQAMRLDPNNPVNYYERGSVYSMKSEYDNAIADYNQAIKLNPGYVEAYRNRGDAYDSKKDYDRAIADYTQAIKLNPGYVKAYRNHGEAYLYKEDYDRAIADYNQAITLDPTDAFAYLGRGVVYHLKGDYDRAIADYNQAITLDPTVAFAYGSRGMAYWWKNDLNRAIADFEEVLRIDPGDADTRKNLAEARRQRGW